MLRSEFVLGIEKGACNTIPGCNLLPPPAPFLQGKEWITKCVFFLCKEEKFRTDFPSPHVPRAKGKLEGVDRCNFDAVALGKYLENA